MGFSVHSLNVAETDTPYPYMDDIIYEQTLGLSIILGGTISCERDWSTQILAKLAFYLKILNIAESGSRQEVSILEF